MNITYYLFQIIFSLAVAFILAGKRKIGVGWGLFFCLTLTVLVGLIIILFSPLKSSPKAYKIKESSDLREIMGIILTGIGLTLFFSSFENLLLLDRFNSTNGIIQGCLSLGFLGLAYYHVRPPLLKVNEKPFN